MLVTGVLGILITFAPLGAYTAYLHPEDSLEFSMRAACIRGAFDLLKPIRNSAAC